MPSAQTAYVGDSMARDILMARDAGIFSILAKYGVSHTTEYYTRLVRVTHWTDEDIQREKQLAERVKFLKPDFVLKNDFGEIIGAMLVPELKARVN